jgi:lipopolysaccharide assembly outer membrane protein LptD (OstA)
MFFQPQIEESPVHAARSFTIEPFRLKHLSFWIILILSAAPVRGLPQETETVNSREEPGFFASPADTVVRDTTAAAGKKKSPDLEGPVTYEAQSIENFVKEKSSVLSGKAKVSYLSMTLTAGKITVDWDKAVLTAEGIPDSSWQKTDSGDSVRVPGFRDLPQFNDGEDAMTGEVMTFNFRTRKGRVLRGRTAYEDGFYGGSILKMPRQNEFHVQEGRYTTCKNETAPHYSFWSKQMKIMVNDKLIAKPIVLFFGKVPLLALPFGLFPIKKGRHSGFLIPRYGESGDEGRYLRGIGYYWAASDYWDLKSTVDYFEKSGVLFRGYANYQVRYKLRGSISGSLTRKDFEALGQKDRRWDLNINHSQEFSPSSRLTVSAYLLSSGSFYREVSPSREYRMQQEIRSNATYSKNFGGSRSIQVNLQQRRNLKTEELSETFPQVSLRVGQIPLFGKSKKASSDPKWYETIYTSYNSQALRRRDKRLASQSQGTFRDTRGMGWKHDFSLSTTQKLSYFNINPSIDVQESWMDSRKTYSLDPETNTVKNRDEKGFFARHIFSTRATVSTKLYGIFRTRLFPEVMVRHVMTPNVSWIYQPDFSKDAYGYYQTVMDSSGKIQSYDRYSESIFSGTPRGGSKSLNFALDNVVQMRIGEGEKAKKVELFKWNLSTGYNGKQKEFKWGEIRTRFYANPLKSVNLDFSASHSPYETDDSGKRINRLYVDGVDWKDWKDVLGSRLLRMTSFSANLSLQVQGRIRTEASATGPTEGQSLESYPQDYLSSAMDPLRNIPGDRFEMMEGYTGMDNEWRLSATLSYTEDRSDPDRVNKTMWFRPSLNLSLTKNWRVSYQSHWDLIKKKPSSQDIVFERDLHCWEARFVWSPTGYNKHFYFKINVKSAMLKELKFEKGTGARGLYGGY